MTPDEELQALAYAIARLETELQATSSPERHHAIDLTLETLRGMHSAILAETKAGNLH
jgi:hypothetical protein